MQWLYHKLLDGAVAEFDAISKLFQFFLGEILCEELIKSF